MMDGFFLTTAPLGAFLAMLGATVQLGLNLGDRQAFMRTAELLDKQGTAAAKEYKIALGYKYPANLTWMSPTSNAWLQRKAPHMLGWLCVAAGAYSLFWASLRPFVEELAWPPFLVLSIGLMALFPALLAYGIITAGKSRPGRLRAETEWRAAHPGATIPENVDRSFDIKLERMHDWLFGHASGEVE